MTLGPIPDSLGAGLSVDFLQHGLVAYARTGVDFNILIQEVCVDGTFQTLAELNGSMSTEVAVGAEFLTTALAPGQSLTIVNVNGRFLTTITLTGTITEC